MPDWLSDNLPQLLLLFPAVSAVVVALSGRPGLATALTALVGVVLAALAATAILAAGGTELIFISDWARTGLGVDFALRLGPARAVAVLLLAGGASAVAIAAHRRGALTPARAAVWLLTLSAVVGAVISADLLLLCVFVEAAWLTALVLTAAGKGPASAVRLMLPCLIACTALLAGVVWLVWLHCEATGVLSFAHADLPHTDEYLVGRAAATMDIFDTAEPVRLLGWVLVYLAGLAGVLAAMRRALQAETLRAAAVALAAAHAAMLALSAAPAILPTDPAAIGWADSHISAVAFAAVVIALGWLGLLACAAYLRRCGHRLAEPQDIRGLARKYPDVAFAAGICLISLAGLPITGGFFARVMLLTSAAGTGALLAMLLLLPPMIVLSATYLSMLMAIAFTGRPAPHEHVVLPGVRGALWRAGITAIVTAVVILGVLPHLLAEPLRMFLR